MRGRVGAACPRGTLSLRADAPRGSSPQTRGTRGEASPPRRAGAPALSRLSLNAASDPLRDVGVGQRRPTISENQVSPKRIPRSASDQADSRLIRQAVPCREKAAADPDGPPSRANRPIAVFREAVTGRSRRGESSILIPVTRRPATDGSVTTHSGYRDRRLLR